MKKGLSRGGDRKGRNRKSTPFPLEMQGESREQVQIQIILNL